MAKKTSPLIKNNCKFVTLDNGYELPYSEMGEENEVVLVESAFYLLSTANVGEELAKKYHYYGFVMRWDGPAEEINEDGSINWARQWGKDVYEATQKLGLDSFHYLGQCHGVIPGYYILKENPDVLLSFSSLQQTLHICEQDQDQWSELPKLDGPAFQLKISKDPRSVARMAEERLIIAKVTEGADPTQMVKIQYYGSHAEEMFDSYDEVKAFLPTIRTPIMYLITADDPLHYDFYTADHAAIYQTAGAKTVIYQDERHLILFDNTDKLVSEIDFFIQQSKYWKFED